MQPLEIFGRKTSDEELLQMMIWMKMMVDATFEIWMEKFLVLMAPNLYEKH